LKKFLFALPFVVIAVMATSVFAERDKPLQKNWDTLSLEQKAEIKGLTIEEYSLLEEEYELKLEKTAALKGMTVEVYKEMLAKEKDWYNLPIEEQAQQKGMSVETYKDMLNKIKMMKK